MLLAPALFTGLAIGPALAQPRAPAVEISADQARQTGMAISITRREDLSPGLAAVRVEGWQLNPEPHGAGAVLALASGGNLAAVAVQIGPAGTTLIIARLDGSQLQVPMPGLISAGFAPDTSHLAAIDGAGSLWRIDASSGQASRLAVGPFLGSPLIGQDGSILVLRVPSVVAPFASRLVRVSADGSTVTELTDDHLVYGAHRLDDGSLAVVVHQPGGTLVLQGEPPESRSLLANLGPDAVNVAVAPDGRAVAWERSGNIYLQELPAGSARPLGAGAHPRFAPDGMTLLIDEPTQVSLLDRAGHALATFDSQAAFASCVGGCQP
jgi:hypothetical protein